MVDRCSQKRGLCHQLQSLERRRTGVEEGGYVNPAYQIPFDPSNKMTDNSGTASGMSEVKRKTRPCKGAEPK